MEDFLATTSSLVDHYHYFGWRLCGLCNMVYVSLVVAEEPTPLVLGHSASRDHSGRLVGVFQLVRNRSHRHQGHQTQLSGPHPGMVGDVVR